MLGNTPCQARQRLSIVTSAKGTFSAIIIDSSTALVSTEVLASLCSSSSSSNCFKLSTISFGFESPVNSSTEFLDALCGEPYSSVRIFCERALDPGVEFAVFVWRGGVASTVGENGLTNSRIGCVNSICSCESGSGTENALTGALTSWRIGWVNSIPVSASSSLFTGCVSSIDSSTGSAALIGCVNSIGCEFSISSSGSTVCFGTGCVNSMVSSSSI
ncbi:hypothetical protein OGAPHI_004745 [Ogataea philodendri]|uniref:Uncharacterized protein n=1 Tax=Ogataea philodendri TaxID=1378263 RepID=A0A9P8P2V8_9ASCO|nr:uncharacterized protein OGAPHI_004745 [Ogataea philodendri]KAH3664031.1 hypothetical protein OGAPHI_004745 [Ogataea philodendri]